jgi:hypothetical protein
LIEFFARPVISEHASIERMLLRLS